MYRSAVLVAALTALTVNSGAQQRRASYLNGGGGDRGKCTVEVIVDGAAEVEIRGDQATLRNLNGNPPQWRRFECTGPLPQNPAGFRFAGVDGQPRNAADAYLKTFQPRFGVAWSPKRSLVVRAGWGRYYTNPNNDYLQNVGYNASTSMNVSGESAAIRLMPASRSIR